METRVECGVVAPHPQRGEVAEIHAAGIVQRERQCRCRCRQRWRQGWPCLGPGGDVAVQAQHQPAPECECAARIRVRDRAFAAQDQCSRIQRPYRLVEQQRTERAEHERHVGCAGDITRGNAHLRRRHPYFVVAQVQRPGQADPRRQGPTLAFDGHAADRGDAGAVRGLAQCDVEVERDPRWRVEVAAAQMGRHRRGRRQRGQGDLDAVDAPVVVDDAAAHDMQAVAQGRDAGFARRAGRKPALQCRHVEDRRIEFHPLHGEIVAARADRAPRQRDEHAFGAQQRRRVAGTLRDHAVQQQLRGAAQAVVDRAGCDDAQAECIADPRQQETGGARRLHQPGQHRDQHGQDDGGDGHEAQQAAKRRDVRFRRGVVHPPSDSGSKASTKASASNTRRSSGRSPMPA